MAKQHVIELNGKRYDAVTGRALPAQAKTAAQAVKRAAMDGFSRATKTKATASSHTPAHKPQKSKTLMRTTVKKPAKTALTQASKSLPRVQPSASVVAAHTDPKPPKVAKSALIRRFSDMSAAPAKSAPESIPQKQTETTRLQTVATATAVPASPITAGLAGAQSHKEPRTKRPRVHARAAKRLHISPRALSAGSLVLAVLVVVGFFTYQNIPNLSMRVASARAGVNGTLPAYQPAGFGLKGGISYKPGQVEIGYRSHSDERNFKITQTASAWNSETLLQNYEPLKDNASYQTIPNKGKTVYIYENSNATWVDGGVWYRVEGDSKLNSEQLLNLVNSL